MLRPLAVAATAWLAACAAAPTRPSFADDLAFLQRHVETIVLTSPTGARVAVVPAWQGRVMTSTPGGDRSDSFGWIHREHVAAGALVPHINVFGGEDRFWLGPEGGQFSIFFAPNARFEFADWQTPAPIDSEPFELVACDNRHARFKKRFTLTNWSGTSFQVGVEREVRIGDPTAVLTRLGADAADAAAVRAVAFETSNTLRNAGDAGWTKATGLLSIWILGMFPASPSAKVLIPFVGGPERYHGRIVEDTYFGKVPADRLRIDEDRSLLVFRADAQLRSKIGIGPARAKPVMGSWDPEAGVLTIVEFTLPVSAREYVNSQWRLQDDPFSGDVVNSYNDGPTAPGAAGLGAFYELESSSPALALGPGEAATHVHRTVHVTGPHGALAAIAQRVLGADLDALPDD